MSRIHTCCWVETPASPGIQARYCGAKITYFVVKRDDDGNRYREYSTLCDFHRHQQAAADEAGEELRRTLQESLDMLKNLVATEVLALDMTVSKAVGKLQRLLEETAP